MAETQVILRKNARSQMQHVMSVRELNETNPEMESSASWSSKAASRSFDFVLPKKALCGATIFGDVSYTNYDDLENHTHILCASCTLSNIYIKARDAHRYPTSLNHTLNSYHGWRTFSEFTTANVNDTDASYNRLRKRRLTCHSATTCRLAYHFTAATVECFAIINKDGTIIRAPACTPGAMPYVCCLDSVVDLSISSYNESYYIVMDQIDGVDVYYPVWSYTNSIQLGRLFNYNLNLTATDKSIIDGAMMLALEGL